MGKTKVPPRMLVDRLERKFQKKIRFHQYKNFAKNLQQLSRLRGASVKDVQDDDELSDMYNFSKYEYTER